MTLTSPMEKKRFPSDISQYQIVSLVPTYLDSVNSIAKTHEQTLIRNLGINDETILFSILSKYGQN